jgi:hypothetical protein
LECLRLACGLPDGADKLAEAIRYWGFISDESQTALPSPHTPLSDRLCAHQQT